MKYHVLIVWLFFCSLLWANDFEATKKYINTNGSLFTNEEINYLTNKKVIKICIMADSYPIEFFKNGKHQGIVGEIFSIFKNNLQIPIEFIPTHNLKDVQEKLFNGTCDMKSIVINETNPYKNIITTKPYLSGNLVLMTTHNKPFLQNVHKKFENEKFVVRHKAYQIFLKKYYPYLQNIEVINDQKEIAKLLENEEIYGYIDLAMISNHFIEHFSLANKVKVNTALDKTISGSIGIVENEKLLLSIFNKLIDTLSTEYIQNLKDSTIVFYSPEVVDYTFLWQVLGVFFVLFCIVFVALIKQNRLKKEIKQQKETFEKLYLKSSDCVILMENDIFTDCNESALKLFEYQKKEQLLGFNPSDVSPHYQPDGRSSREKAKEMIEIAIQNGSHRFEWVHKKSTDQEFWVEVVLTILKIKDRDIIHALMRNISERKKLEHQSRLLAHQSKKAALGRLMSLIAHQWRQPLSIINGITSTSYHSLGKYDVDFEQMKSNLLQIENITVDLSNAIQKIHDFYVYEEERNAKGTRIKCVINECLELLYPSFANNLEPHVVINEIDPIKLSGYTYGMHQTILTLLTNCEEIFALRNIPHPRITIDLYKQDNFSHIVVKDNGGGIEKEIIDKIFEPYVSTKNNIKKMRGLGLNIAKDIVENHLKGSIEVQSLEDGAMFTIRYKEYENQ